MRHGPRGGRLVVLDAGSQQDFDPAFAALTRAKSGRTVVTSDPLLLGRRDRLVALAAQQMTPAVYAWRAYAVSAGLISYGINY